MLSHSGFFAPISFAQASLAQIWAQKNRMICIIRFSAVRGGFFLRHSPGAPAGTLQRQKSFGCRLGFLFLHHPPDCKEACISCIMQKKIARNSPYDFAFAVRGGFEPPEPLRVRQFSKLLVSATHPPHQSIKDCKGNTKRIKNKFILFCYVFSHFCVGLDVFDFVVIHYAEVA